MKRLELTVIGIDTSIPIKRWSVNTPEEVEEEICKLKELLQKYPGLMRFRDMARVYFRLDRDIKIKLIPGDKEMVEITSGTKKGVVPRGDDGVTVSTSAGYDNPYLCTNVLTEDPDHYDHPFLDRGLCWVHSGNPGRVELVLHSWGEKSFAPDQLSKLIRKAEQRANEEIDGVLRAPVEA